MKGRNNKINFRKHICLYKVHGSLNTFKFNSDNVENNSWIYEDFKSSDNLSNFNIERIIVTPGIKKYEKLHNYRAELLSKYDEAIEKHNSFIFIGFGFNDNQLFNNTIRKKLYERGCPSIIVTREKNQRIVDVLKSGENTWLICSHESNENNSLVYNNKYSKPYIAENLKLWDMEIFTKEILGE